MKLSLSPWRAIKDQTRTNKQTNYLRRINTYKSMTCLWNSNILLTNTRIINHSIWDTEPCDTKYILLLFWMSDFEICLHFSLRKSLYCNKRCIFTTPYNLKTPGISPLSNGMHNSLVIECRQGLFLASHRRYLRKSHSLASISVMAHQAIFTKQINF